MNETRWICSTRAMFQPCTLWLCFMTADVILEMISDDTIHFFSHMPEFDRKSENRDTQNALGGDYEDIALNDLYPREYKQDKETTTLYDYDQPDVQYPPWVPVLRSRAVRRHRLDHALFIVVVLITAFAIFELLHYNISGVPAKERSFILYSTGKPSLTSHVQQEWVLREFFSETDNRTLISTNDMMPGPTIEAWQDDIITIHIKNEMKRSTSIHWHGMSQSSSNTQDGVPLVTQDYIEPGEGFVYTFKADESGTFWWHAHAHTSRIDGLYGALLVHPRVASQDATMTGLNSTHTDMVILAGDWYNSETTSLLTDYLARDNIALIEPLPTSIRLNTVVFASLSGTFVLPKLPVSTRYWRLRIINVGAIAEIRVVAPSKADGVLVIEADSSRTMPLKVDSLTVAPGQRYSLLLDAVDYTSKDDIELTFSLEMSSHHHTQPPSSGSYMHTSHNHNHEIHHKHQSRSPPYHSDRGTLQSLIHLHEGMLHPLLTDAQYHNTSKVMFQTSRVTTLTLGMRELDGISRSTINGHTYVPSNHTLVQDYDLLGVQKQKHDQFHQHQNSTLSNKYSLDTPTLSLEHGESVLLLFRNHGGGNHPMHVHGHRMMLLANNEFYFDPVSQQRTTRPFDEHSLVFVLRAAQSGSPLERALERDTINVPDQGWALVKLTGVGKGLWSIHCHSLWHEMSGMSMLLEVR